MTLLYIQISSLAGINGKYIESINLQLDEFEAFRLADNLHMTHQQAAEEMGISRSSFTRLIEKSRKKIADFIINGKFLTIDGGNIHFLKNIFKCNDCGFLFKTTIDSKIETCPECNSKNILNIAGGFGHGECCRKHSKSLQLS
ncbi:MAG: DUF134 domain-containing protein [Saprospiraceae bacterium]